MIDFDATPEEHYLATIIAARARTMGVDRPRIDLEMDITATHRNGCPLDLEKFRNFSDFDFLHDIHGIARHLDRETGKLTGCFRPRCAKHDATEATTPERKQSKRARTTTVARVVLKPIQCCRCKRIHSESDRVYVQRLIHGMPGKQSTCPRCGAHSYYSLRADGKPTRFGEQQADEITITERVRR